MTAPHHRRIDAERRDHVHGAAHRIAHDQHRPQDRPVPGLARLPGAQIAFLVPVEVRLLVHLRAVLACRHRERTDMHAVGLGALQQGHVAEPRGDLFEGAEQVPQHRLVGPDLLVFLPARDQPRPLVECGIDEMGDAGEPGRESGAGIGVGEIERRPARAECLVGTAARDGDHLAARLACEMLHGGIADEAGGAGDQDFSGRHGTDWKGMSGATAFRTIRCRGRTLPKCAGDTALFFRGRF